MTTGVLLRRLHGDPELNGITHVIVDEVSARRVALHAAASRTSYCAAVFLRRHGAQHVEHAGGSCVARCKVHERNLDSDFLLIILRDLLPKRADLRLVLMSATMNADQFAAYVRERAHACSCAFACRRA
jgi:HrpA-like RNA helicase